MKFDVLQVLVTLLHHSFERVFSCEFERIQRIHMLSLLHGKLCVLMTIRKFVLVFVHFLAERKHCENWLLLRQVSRRGRSAFVIKIGGEEIDYDQKFQLILQSKLPNPHYR